MTTSTGRDSRLGSWLSDVEADLCCLGWVYVCLLMIIVSQQSRLPEPRVAAVSAADGGLLGWRFWGVPFRCDNCDDDGALG